MDGAGGPMEVAYNFFFYLHGWTYKINCQLILYAPINQCASVALGFTIKAKSFPDHTAQIHFKNVNQTVQVANLPHISIRQLTPSVIPWPWP